MSRTWIAGVIAGVLAVTATACGGDDSPSGSPVTTPVVESTDAAPDATEPAGETPATEPPSAAFPVTVAAGNGEVTLDEEPARIVSISPTHTEMLFAIGAGAQVVAVDSLSNFPAEAASVVTDLSAYEPSIEAIAEYEPDLVVIGDDTSAISSQLAQLGIPVWFGPAAVSFDDVYAQIEQLGALTGQIGGAAELVGQMRTDIDAIVAGLPELAEPLTYYHELDDTYFSVTSNTFIGQVYALLGLRNIADLGEHTTDYPQLSAEFIVTKDPDIIFLADTICCAQNSAAVAERPGWSSLGAVANGTVVELDDDVASRWGPRIVDLLRQASDAVTAAAAVAS